MRTKRHHGRALRRRYGHLFGFGKPFVPTRGGEQTWLGNFRVMKSHGGEFLIYGKGDQYKTTVDSWPQAVRYVEGQAR